MKKVNFNALQNFEVPESWIENAINAKPKKKLFHLNPLHLSTAACLVIAVSNSIFSPLNLNRNFTPLTGSIVEDAIVGGADNSSTFTYPKDEELLTQNEIKTTFLAETTKTTEKPKATGAVLATEQNEEPDEQNITSEDQNNENSKSEGNASAQTEAIEPKENPGRNEQTNNTKKPEQSVNPKETDRPIEEQKRTERVIDNTVSTEAEEPKDSIKTINKTGWDISDIYTTDSGASDVEITVGEKEQILCGDLFTNTIEITLPNDIRNDEYITVICTIKGTRGYTNNVEGTLTFNLKDSINTLIEYEIIQEGGIISINLSDASIDIPCGEYKITLKCEDVNYEKSITITLNNYSDSVELDFR